MLTINNKQEKLIIAGIFILGLVLVSLLLFFRFQLTADVSFGEETFAQLIVLESNNPSTFVDVIFLFLLGSSPSTTALIVYAILFFTSIFFLTNLILKRLNISFIQKSIALTLLIFTPEVLNIFLRISHAQIILASSLLLVLVFLNYRYLRLNSIFHKQKYSSIFLVLLLLLLTYINFVTGTFAFLLVLIYSAQKKDFFLQKSLLLTYLITSLSLFFFFPKFVFFNIFFSSFQINHLFSFFGATYGFSLLLLLFGVAGFFTTSKNLSSLTKIIIISLFLSSLFYLPARILTIFILIFFASSALEDIFKRNWSLSVLKEPFLILVFCILLFSTMTYVQETSFQSPTSQEISAMDFLHTYSLSNNSSMSILTHPNMMYQTWWYSKVPSITVYNLSSFSLDDFNTLFTSQDAHFIFKEFEYYNISYIYLQEAIDTKKYQRPVRGLDLIMKYNSRFTKIYHKDGQVIYEFK